MKKRQEIANEIRDYVTKINARIAELEEQGYKVKFGNLRWGGKLTHVSIEKIVKL